LNVAGSMTSTVLLSELGTYTELRKSLTSALSWPGRSAAYPSLGSSTGGIPGSGPEPTGTDVVVDVSGGLVVVRSARVRRDPPPPEHAVASTTNAAAAAAIRRTMRRPWLGRRRASRASGVPTRR